MLKLALAKLLGSLSGGAVTLTAAAGLGVAAAAGGALYISGAFDSEPTAPGCYAVGFWGTGGDEASLTTLFAGSGLISQEYAGPKTKSTFAVMSFQAIDDNGALVQDIIEAAAGRSTIIAGHSSGGAVAFDVANELAASGEVNVALLIELDTYTGLFADPIAYSVPRDLLPDPRIGRVLNYYQSGPIFLTPGRPHEFPANYLRQDIELGGVGSLVPGPGRGPWGATHTQIDEFVSGYADYYTTLQWNGRDGAEYQQRANLAREWIEGLCTQSVLGASVEVPPVPTVAPLTESPLPPITPPTAPCPPAPGWSVGSLVGLRRGAEIWTAPGNGQLTVRIPDDAQQPWNVVVKDGPRCVGPDDWYDIDRETGIKIRSSWESSSALVWKRAGK